MSVKTRKSARTLALASVLLAVTGTAVAQEEGRYSFLDGEVDYCREFLDHLNAPFDLHPKEAPSISEVVSASDVEPLAMPKWYSTTPIVFPMWIDFDNDGMTDLVSRRDGAGSFLYGTILFVAYGSESTTPKSFPEDAEAAYSFPCQFDESSPKSTECPLVAGNRRGGGVQVSLKEEPYFSGRYTNIRILRRQGRTYLQLKSNTREHKAYAAIIEPYDRRKFRAVCLFKRPVSE